VLDHITDARYDLLARDNQDSRRPPTSSALGAPKTVGASPAAMHALAASDRVNTFGRSVDERV